MVLSETGSHTEATSIRGGVREKSFLVVDAGVAKEDHSEFAFGWLGRVGNPSLFSNRGRGRRARRSEGSIASVFLTATSNQ